MDIRIATDRDTGRSKGYAFLTMSSGDEADDAVKALHGLEIDGRPIKVEVASGRGGGGPRGPRSNVCYDWRRGTCTRGGGCRFDHFEEGGGRGGGGGGGGGYRGGRDYDDRYGDKVQSTSCEDHYFSSNMLI